MRYDLPLTLVFASLSTVTSAAPPGRPKNGHAQAPKPPDPLVTIHTERACPQDDDKKHTLAQRILNQAHGCWRFANAPVLSISSEFKHKRGYQTLKLFSDSNCEELAVILTNVDPPTTRKDVVRATGGCYEPGTVEGWNSYIFTQGPENTPQQRGW